MVMEQMSINKNGLISFNCNTINLKKKKTIKIIFLVYDGCMAYCCDNDCFDYDNELMWTVLDFLAFDTNVLQVSHLKVYLIQTLPLILSSVLVLLLWLELLFRD